MYCCLYYNASYFAFLVSLQIDLVLTTEEAFQVFRQWFLKKKDEIKPNKHSDSRYLKKIRSAVWAGVDENFTADNIVTTLNKSPSVSSYTCTVEPLNNITFWDKLFCSL